MHLASLKAVELRSLADIRDIVSLEKTRTCFHSNSDFTETVEISQRTVNIDISKCTTWFTQRVIFGK